MRWRNKVWDFTKVWKVTTINTIKLHSFRYKFVKISSNKRMLRMNTWILRFSSERSNPCFWLGMLNNFSVFFVYSIFYFPYIISWFAFSTFARYFKPSCSITSIKIYLRLKPLFKIQNFLNTNNDASYNNH